MINQDKIVYTYSWAVGIFLGMTIRYINMGTIQISLSSLNEDK